LRVAIVTLVVIVLVVTSAVTWVLRAGHGNSAAGDARAITEATQLLVANGVKVRHEARSRSLLPNPIVDSLPQSIAGPVRRLEIVYRVVFEDGAKLTPEVARLMNRFPILSLEATGEDFDDTSLASLEDVRQLTGIYLDDTAVTDAEISRFRIARPDVRLFIRTAVNSSESITQ
jgi:hypothetical protein